MVQKEYYLSQEKFDELTQELVLLRDTTRKEIADKLQQARALGDLSENAEYHSAREEQAQIEARIREIEALLQYGTIVARHKSDVVEIGSAVTVTKKGSKEKRVFEIVGSSESDATAGKIANDSPLALALLGAAVGETVTMETPAGKKMSYTIVSIE